MRKSMQEEEAVNEKVFKDEVEGEEVASNEEDEVSLESNQVRQPHSTLSYWRPSPPH